MIQFIQHPADRDDLISLLKDKTVGYAVVIDEVKPAKGTAEYESWLGANKFFHTAIVKRFSDITGYTRKEAKEILQIRHALVVEDRDYYYVESTSDMSTARLAEFNDQCLADLLSLFGEVVSMTEYEFKQHMLKAKKAIKKHR